MTKREQAIQLIAAVVVEANKECYAMLVEDDSTDGCEFKDFGTDPDTVECILQDMSREVAVVVEKLQSQ